MFAIGVLPDGRPYLVMSLLEGHSLREELAIRGRLSPEEAWRIAREVADALAAAHEAGIVHRDLKPDNVFLEKFKNRPAAPRILDFGLAKVSTGETAPDVAKLTQTGVMMGTPAYMAPEQWWNSGIDARTDQYAFGVLLYEMLAGSPPFRSEQYIELLQKHLHESPPSLADRGAAVGPEVEALVAHCLAKKGEQRFESMRAVLEAGDAAFGTPSTSVPAAAVSPTTISHAETIESEAVVPQPSRAAETRIGGFLLRHLAILLAGLGGLLAMGYAGYARQDPGEWIHIAGFVAFADIFLFVVAWGALVWIARARIRKGHRGRTGWWLAFLPALSGALGTYMGWVMATAAMTTRPTTERFATFNLGMYEANTSRFMGFAFSMILFLALVALPTPKGEPTSPGAVLPLGRRERVGAIGGLLLLSAIALVAGAPSGAFVSSVAAVGLLLAGLHAPGRPRECAIGDAFAALVATVLAAAVGLARVEAREAALWDEAPSRTARAAEILAAAAERTATSVIAVAAVAVSGLAVVLTLRRVRGTAGWPRPAVSSLLVGAALVGLLVTDVTLYSRVTERRDAFREAIADRFSELGRLEVPVARGLDPERFPTHDAPAVQITRTVVAINAAPAALVSAIETPAAETAIGNALTKALADAALERSERPSDLEGRSAAGPSEPDLSFAVDQEVHYEVVERVLQLACRALACGRNAAQVEFRFLQDAPPRLPRSAPPEARYVLPRDFYGVPASFTSEGPHFTASADARFSNVARKLTRTVQGGAIRLPIE